MIKEFNYGKTEDYDKILDKYKEKNFKLIEINKETIGAIRIDKEKVKQRYLRSFSNSIILIEENLKLRYIFDKVLHLPEYCGPGMDSVHDCFYDENWTKGKKVVLLIKDIENFFEYEGLLRIFLDIYHRSKKSNFKFDVWIFGYGVK